MSLAFDTLGKQCADAVTDDAKKDAIVAFDDAFQQALAEVVDKSSAAEALEDEVNGLEAVLAKLLADDGEASEPMEDAQVTCAVNCADYYAFLTGRSQAIGKFTTLEAALKGVADGDAVKVQGDWDGSNALASEEAWAAERRDLAELVQSSEKACSLVDASLTAADTTVSILSNLLDSVDSLRPKAVAASSAFAAKNEGGKATRAEMESERVGLLTWCRQQKTNLDAMVEPDHAQEFCSSMLANFASMDKNFHVLLDFTYQLPGDEALQRDMLECNEVWLNLQVSAYERMRHALLEVHPKSKLEDEVREFISFTDEVLEFITKVKELFSNTNDPESDRFVRPVIDEADALLGEFGMHEGLPKQLQEFCNRMDCLRDSYSNLRRAVLSRLTFLTSSVPALTASMRRKEEYVARMRDLKSWVEVKSQGETWGDIHERILSIKALIEQEQLSLNEAKTA